MEQIYDLNPALTSLQKGGIILYPTDTIWGLGCDATDASAVDRIYEIKKRERSKPLILLVSSIEMLKEYVAHLHPRIETLLLYHVQPLTIIYDQAKNLPAISYSTNGSVGIRIPNDKFCKELINALGKPLISTSANISNEPFPNHFGEISSEVIIQVDYVVKHRQWEKNMNAPSVVARLGNKEKAELEFLRS